MPLIKQTLESDIKSAAKSAYLKTLQKGKTLKEDNDSAIADVFANEISKKLASAIETYIKGAIVKVDVTVVTATGGPGKGTGIGNLE